MTAFLFPDNTVLCNFASVDRLDLLRTVLHGCGRWTEAIAAEAAKSSRNWPKLSQLVADGWLGEPIEISDPLDLSLVEQTRRGVFGGTQAKHEQHLGEAQTCYVILNWSEFAGSSWISDDKEALRYARGQGIPTLETIDLVKIAVHRDHLGAEDAVELMRRMFERGRRPRLPKSAEDFRR